MSPLYAFQPPFSYDAHSLFTCYPNSACKVARSYGNTLCTTQSNGALFGTPNRVAHDDRIRIGNTTFELKIGWSNHE